MPAQQGLNLLSHYFPNPRSAHFTRPSYIWTKQKLDSFHSTLYKAFQDSDLNINTNPVIKLVKENAEYLHDFWVGRDFPSSLLELALKYFQD